MWLTGIGSAVSSDFVRFSFTERQADWTDIKWVLDECYFVTAIFKVDSGNVCCRITDPESSWITCENYVL